MSETLGEKVQYLSKGSRIVEEAEKEASEVLHSLLSVERIEKPDNSQNIQHQVVVLSNNSEDIQWHSATLHHNGDVYTLDNGNPDYGHQEHTVVWDNAIALDVETTQSADHFIVPEDNHTIEHSQEQKNQKQNNKSFAKKSGVQKLKKKVSKLLENVCETPVEENGEGDDANDVRQRFEMGCECQDDSCFRGLNPDNVYKHRLNIAELTKEEHDMYLMGVTMACMSDPGVTVKQRERRRLRAQYVYQGRRVCLSAFLYLENCTLYQLKRIRKHVMTHGVTPRVHGNHGKKPHNVFSLETYRRATDFLKGYVEQHNSSTGNCKNTVIFPPDISRKTIHNLYQDFMKKSALPEEKTMGYSTFRHFMKEQFPHVRFCKVEIGNLNCSSSNQSVKHNMQTSGGGNTHRGTNTEDATLAHTMVVQSPPTAPAPMQAVTTIPVLIQEQNKTELAAQTAYLVTPMSQIVQAPYQVTVTPITNYAFTTL